MARLTAGASGRRRAGLVGALVLLAILFGTLVRPVCAPAPSGSPPPPLTLPRDASYGRSVPRVCSAVYVDQIV